jgi:hypothetical protein
MILYYYQVKGGAQFNIELESYDYSDDVPKRVRINPTNVGDLIRKAIKQFNYWTNDSDADFETKQNRRKRRIISIHSVDIESGERLLIKELK